MNPKIPRAANRVESLGFLFWLRESGVVVNSRTAGWSAMPETKIDADVAARQW